MGVTSALVLFAVIWFMTFLIVIPIRLQTQGDVGTVVPGTHAGSPENHSLKKKAWITTAISARFVVHHSRHHHFRQNQRARSGLV